LNLLFNQTALPTGYLPGDVALLNGVTVQGSDTLFTQGAPPTLVPGTRYFLGVQNPGNSAAKFAIEIDTDVGTNVNIIALNNEVPVATTNVSTTGPDYYSFSVPANAAMVTFQILNPNNAELDLYARDGLPVPAPFDFDYDSRNSGAVDQFIVVTTNSAPVPLPDTLPTLPPSTWYLSVYNPTGAAAVNYTIVATCVSNPVTSVGTPNTNILNIITLTTNTFTKTAMPGYPSNYVYSYMVPGNPGGLQFTVTNISGVGNVQLLVQNGTFPTPAQSYSGSFNPGISPQVIAFGTNANLPTLTNTTWYLAVYNTSTNSVDYSITAVTLATPPVTTQPLFLGSSVSTAANQFTLNWDATPGSNYTVQVSTNLTTWSTVTNITAQSSTVTYTDTVPVNSQQSRFFRLSTP
jgi:hypothetical protein